MHRQSVPAEDEQTSSETMIVSCDNINNNI